MTMDNLLENLKQRFAAQLDSCVLSPQGEITIELPKQHLREVCLALRDERVFRFEQLVDLCGVDYLAYGSVEWETVSATEEGFSRGRVKDQDPHHRWSKPRFAVVYHLNSFSNNQRLRVRVFCSEDDMIVDSVVDIWNCANWYEREAFDLFGIIFEGHPDLRRILTDYGFIGHPFRKDFPMIGQMELRYDADKARVVYEPVSIEERVLVPKVIRDDHRYADEKHSGDE